MTDHQKEFITTVEKQVRLLHQKKFHVLWEVPTRKGEWCGRNKINQNLAFLFTVLHKFTGKERYLDLAKKYIVEFESPHYFEAVFFSKAIELLGDNLTGDMRKQIASGWVGAAWEILNEQFKSPQDVKRLDNVANTNLCAAVYADYTRKLFPEESKPHHFETITDLVWDVWWKRREFQEQASNYEGFSEAYHCVWAELRGVKDEFFSSPSIQNMFARNERIISPGGIVTPYGDSGYFEHVSAWIALFEKVARETRNGELKHTARQMFECYKSYDLNSAAKNIEKALNENLTNGRLLYGQYIHNVSWLAMAALWTDPTLKEEPRTNYAGTNTRLPYAYKLRKNDTEKSLAKKSEVHQVALTGGSKDPKRQTYLLLSVGQSIHHDHADAGAIHAISKGHSCLLGSTGYFQQEFPYHNVFYAQKSSNEQFPEDSHHKIFSGDKDYRGELEDLRIGTNDSYCRILFENYHNMPLTLRREIIIDQQGVVTLMDRVTAHEKGLCGGQLFHAEKIKKLSPTSYRLRNDKLVHNISASNPKGTLKIDFVYPGTDTSISKLRLAKLFYHPGYKRYPCHHYLKIWKRSYSMRQCLHTRQELRAGEEEVFITHLTPEGTKWMA